MSTLQTSTGSANPIRILALDDEESIRRVVRHGLEQAGCIVETAPNGRVGLHMLLNQTFDVAVVDLRMQEMDGITFIQEARKIWPWQRFVIYSGFVDERYERLAREEGIRTILAKPLDMKQLLEAVRKEIADDRPPPAAADVQLPRRLISHQTNIMRHIAREVLHSHSLLNGLVKLGESIHGMLPYHVMGVLSAKEEPLVFLQSLAPQPDASYEDVQRNMVARYEALSGQHLDLARFRIERAAPRGTAGGTRTFRSITSVPVINGDVVEGIMTLASYDQDAFDDLNVALLYQAASSLSTLLSALHEMKQMATRDPLTGLYNRRMLNEELERAWRLSSRYGHPMALLMIDLDELKTLNDRWGHQTGDAALRAFAGMLKATARSTDILARYGGDEFVVLLPQAGRGEAAVLGDRIIRALRATNVQAGGRSMPLRASAGIVAIDPDESIGGPEDILERADRALYHAKNKGGGRIETWAPEAGGEPGTAAGAEDGSPGVRGRVLVLDDEEYVLLTIREILTREGFAVTAVRTLAEAMETLKARGREFDVMLCDLMLPDGDGMEALHWAGEHLRDLVGVIITGNATADNAITALRAGVYDFVQKPVTPAVLTALLNRALQFRMLSRENQRYRDHLEEMVRAKQSELQQALGDIRTWYEFTLETMVAMLDAREFETGQHSLRVKRLTMILAAAMGIEGSQLEEIGRGALLHDIGKVGIPDSILLKPGKLTEDEWAVMRRHPDIGYRFLKNSAFLMTAAGVVHSHHERWDGSGYPQGLKGEAISIGARIFAVIDAYDALRSSRVYKNSISREEAVTEIERCAGTQFDPAVVGAFLNCIDEIERVGGWSQSFA